MSAAGECDLATNQQSPAKIDQAHLEWTSGANCTRSLDLLLQSSVLWGLSFRYSQACSHFLDPSYLLDRFCNSCSRAACLLLPHQALLHGHPEDQSQSTHPMKHHPYNHIADILQGQGGRMDVWHEEASSTRLLGWLQARIDCAFGHGCKMVAENAGQVLESCCPGMVAWVFSLIVFLSSLRYSWCTRWLRPPIHTGAWVLDWPCAPYVLSMTQHVFSPSVTVINRSLTGQCQGVKFCMPMLTTSFQFASNFFCLSFGSSIDSSLHTMSGS